MDVLYTDVIQSQIPLAGGHKQKVLCTFRFAHKGGVIPCPATSFGTVFWEKHPKDRSAPLRALRVYQMTGRGGAWLFDESLTRGAGNQIELSEA